MGNKKSSLKSTIAVSLTNYLDAGAIVAGAIGRHQGAVVERSQEHRLVGNPGKLRQFGIQGETPLLVQADNLDAGGDVGEGVGNLAVRKRAVLLQGVENGAHALLGDHLDAMVTPRNQIELGVVRVALQTPQLGEGDTALAVHAHRKAPGEETSSFCRVLAHEKCHPRHQSRRPDTPILPFFILFNPF